MHRFILIAGIVGALETVKTLSYTRADPHGWLHPERECIEGAMPSLPIKIEPKIWLCLVFLGELPFSKGHILFK